MNGDFKDLTRGTASEKILRDKAFNIAENPKYDGYQCELASVVYKFFDKKTLDLTVKNENMSDGLPSELALLAKVSHCMRQLAEELHKPITRKLHSTFMDNI